jgi:hypothetical protein
VGQGLDSQGREVRQRGQGLFDRSLMAPFTVVKLQVSLARPAWTSFFLMRSTPACRTPNTTHRELTFCFERSPELLNMQLMKTVFAHGSTSLPRSSHRGHHPMLATVRSRTQPLSSAQNPPTPGKITPWSEMGGPGQRGWGTTSWRLSGT